MRCQRPRDKRERWRTSGSAVSEKGMYGVSVGFSAGGTLSNLVWDFKAFLHVAAARGESGSGGDGTEDSESSGKVELMLTVLTS